MRENLKLKKVCVKMVKISKIVCEIKKVCVKATSSCVKNIEKRPEKRFTHTLDFHGKKPLPYNLPTSKNSYTYQLFCFHFTNLPTPNLKNLQTTSFKIVNLPTFQISQTYQLKISKTCKLPTFFSESGGGPSPP